ncbi:MAG: condensin complex protein MksE [Desulfovermiculus sp.]
MLEEYINLDMQVLLENDNLSRRIIHRLQAGQNIDSQLIGEYRFLDTHYDIWSAFFAFLGYRLQRSSQGGEAFYHLAPRSSRIKVASLRRGATFLGLFLAWHFMSAGIEGKDEVLARELLSRLENSFEFNQLIRVFNPQQKRTIRTRQQSDRKMQQLTGWVLTSLRDLHRLRFIELYPSVNADFDALRILRLPALVRFLEPARRSLDLEYAGQEDLDAAIHSIWTSIDWEEEENEDNGSEDT